MAELKHLVSAFDDNLIDGHGLFDSLISGLRLLHFHFSQSFLSKCSRAVKKKRKRTTVQVAPAAIVCTGYDTYTVRHFGSQINKMASFQVTVARYIPLWPQAAEKWLWVLGRLWLNTRRFTPVISFGSATLPVVVRLFRGEEEDTSSEGRDSRGLVKSLATLSSPQYSANKSFGSKEAWYIDKLFSFWIFITVSLFFRITEQPLHPACKHL